jgi:hypothetical protein
VAPAALRRGSRLVGSLDGEEKQCRPERGRGQSQSSTRHGRHEQQSDEQADGEGGSARRRGGSPMAYGRWGRHRKVVAERRLRRRMGRAGRARLGIEDRLRRSLAALTSGGRPLDRSPIARVPRTLASVRRGVPLGHFASRPRMRSGRSGRRAARPGGACRHVLGLADDVRPTLERVVGRLLDGLPCRPCRVGRWQPARGSSDVRRDRVDRDFRQRPGRRGGGKRPGQRHGSQKHKHRR